MSEGGRGGAEGGHDSPEARRSVRYGEGYIPSTSE